MSKKKVQVVMLTTAAGPEFVYRAGEIVEIEKDQADAWIEAGAARLAEQDDLAPQAGRTRHIRAFVVEEETLTAPEQATGAREKGKK